MKSLIEAYSDEQTQDATTQTLMDILNESFATPTKKATPEKEDTEDVFFKQLVADMNKKYVRQAQSQESATNDTPGINATPEKMSESFFRFVIQNRLFLR